MRTPPETFALSLSSSLSSVPFAILLSKNQLILELFLTNQYLYLMHQAFTERALDICNQSRKLHGFLLPSAV